MTNLTTQQPAMAMENKIKNKNLFYFPMVSLNEKEEMENKFFQFQSIAEETTNTKKMIWLFNKLSKEVMECE
jgi:hypothetical protein